MVSIPLSNTKGMLAINALGTMAAMNSSIDGKTVGVLTMTSSVN